MHENLERRPQRPDPADVDIHHENLVESKHEHYGSVGRNDRAVRRLPQGQMDQNPVTGRRPFVQIVQRRQFSAVRRVDEFLVHGSSRQHRVLAEPTG